MVDNSKKLRHEHEIEARACIIGYGFVFAASETVEPPQTGLGYAIL
jgi:hypothetical protein